MEKVNIQKYILTFGLYYACAVIITSLIVILFDISLHSSVRMGLVVAISYIVSFKFIKEQNRAPSTSEKHKLIWGSIAASFIVSLMLIVAVTYKETGADSISAFFASSGLGDLSLAIWALFFGVIIGFYWLTFYLVYGWGAKKLAQTHAVTDDKLD